MSKLEMLTPQNSAIALIDYQPAMYQGVQSHDRIVVFNNIQILAKGGEALQDTDGAEPPSPRIPFPGPLCPR